MNNSNPSSPKVKSPKEEIDWCLAQQRAALEYPMDRSIHQWLTDAVMEEVLIRLESKA